MVLATGGIGKSFKVTSNSWEYTGDGHALAMKAGATLLNMEFVQFHPTGMVWPPSVKGILVTESVRGDGGVLKNSEGKRFMFDYVPAVFRKQYAETEQEADAWYDDQANNRRPPELLPRDEVARAINSEVKAGRGSPAGGVFLDIASRLPAEAIRKKLPSMYHQFKELADVDITAEPMEVGPTCHYVMGGVEVDPDTAAAVVPGLFAAGEVAGGMHGSNRLGGNSLSDLLVFGRRAGLGAAEYVDALGSARPTVTDGDVEDARTQAEAPFAGTGGENPYAIHADLQQMMNDLVGIIRTKDEVERALAGLEELKARAAKIVGAGRQGLQPRLAPRPRPAEHAHRVGVHRPLRADPRGVPRRSHPRRPPDDEPGVAQGQPGLPAGRRRGRGHPAAAARHAAGAAVAVRPRGAEQVHDRRRARDPAGGEGLMSYNARFRVWRGDDTDGELEDFSVEVKEGEVILDIIHRLQATQTPDLAVRWNCKAGKCGSCSAEVNGRPRLMCMTRMSTFTEDEVITVTPLRAFPVIKDLVTDVSFNYQKAREVPAFAPPTELAPGEYRMQQVDVERSQEFRKCIECFLCQDTCHVIRDHEENKESFAGPRFFIRLAELDMHPLDTKDRKREAQATHGLGMCNITKCCTEVCPEHIKITDNAIIPMKERVVDTQYDPLIWLGSKIPRRSAMAASRASPAATRRPPRRRPASGCGTSPRTRPPCARWPRRCAPRAGSPRRSDDHPDASSSTPAAGGSPGWTQPRRTPGRCSARSRTGELPLDRVEDEIAATLQQAQRLASTGTVLAGTHALHHLVHGRLAEAVEHAREAIVWDRDRSTRADDLVTLAEALAGLGESDESASAMTEALQLWPDNPRLTGVRANLEDMNVRDSLRTSRRYT